jgi:hypothetical protein
MNPTEETPAAVPASPPLREQWVWLGSWGAGRRYVTGTVEKGQPVVRDGGHVYVCLREHFSTEYDRPSTGGSFWGHVASFCCPSSEVELRG